MRLLCGFSIICSFLLLSCVTNNDIPDKYHKIKTGIDVSHHQGAIDWSLVSTDTTVGFVYIKATEGATYIDSKYHEYIEGAKKAGLLVGSYHFFRMTSTPQEQFVNFRHNVDKNIQDLIPMVDVETTDNYSVSDLQQNLKVFIDSIVEYYGVRPMIYGTNRSYNQYLAPKFNDYPLYIGRYGQNAPAILGNGEYTIWQYSETEKITGIEKMVDKCIFHVNHSISEILMPTKK